MQKNGYLPYYRTIIPTGLPLLFYRNLSGIVVAGLPDENPYGIALASQKGSEKRCRFYGVSQHSRREIALG